MDSRELASFSTASRKQTPGMQKARFLSPGPIFFCLFTVLVGTHGLRLHGRRSSVEAMDTLVARARLGRIICDCENANKLAKFKCGKFAAKLLVEQTKPQWGLGKRKFHKERLKEYEKVCSGFGGTYKTDDGQVLVQAIKIRPAGKANPTENCCVAISNTNGYFSAYKLWQNTKKSYSWDDMVDRVSASLANNGGECTKWFKSSLASKLLLDPCKVNLFGLGDGDGMDYQSVARLARVISHEPLNRVIGGDARGKARSGAFTFYPYLKDMEATIFMAKGFLRVAESGDETRTDYGHKDKDIANVLNSCIGFTYTCNELYTTFCSGNGGKKIYWVQDKLGKWKHSSGSIKDGLDFDKTAKFNGEDKTVEQLLVGSMVPSHILSGDVIKAACKNVEENWCIKPAYLGTLDDNGHRVDFYTDAKGNRVEGGYQKLKIYYNEAMEGSGGYILMKGQGPYKLGVLFDKKKDEEEKQDELSCT